MWSYTYCMFCFTFSIQSMSSKAHPGKIVSLELCPINHNLVLIGYEKGIVVLWDFEHGLPTKNFPASIQDCQQVCQLSTVNVNDSLILLQLSKHPFQ